MSLSLCSLVNLWITTRRPDKRSYNDTDRDAKSGGLDIAKRLRCLDLDICFRNDVVRKRSVLELSKIAISYQQWLQGPARK